MYLSMVQIGVIGDSDASDEQRGLAKEVGRQIARAGAVLVCGGRGGIMGAACEGCKGAGGTTVGILPGIDGKGGNEFLDIQIRTGMGYTRNSIVANSSDAVIVVGGSHGTLSEMCFASFEAKPIVVVKGGGGWGEELAGRKLGEEARELVLENVENAVSTALELLKQ